MSKDRKVSNISDELKELRSSNIVRFRSPVWKVNNLKEISHMVVPIFIQLIFNVLIAQINLIIINWYDNGVYADSVSRATLAYVAFQFVPSFVAVGTIIVCGKLIGQNRQAELSKVIVTGIIINLLISSFLVTVLDFFANEMCDIVSPGDNVIDSNTKHWIVTFYRILNIQLLLSSVLQVLVAPLQALKKSRHVSIGAIASNFVDISFVLFVLFVLNFEWKVLMVAASVSLAVLFQIVYMLILNFKYIDFKVNKRKQVSMYFAKETLLAGMPITCEMMIFFLTTLVVSSCMSRINIGNNYGKDTAVTLYRNLNSIVQYLSAFTSALGTTSSVFVSKKIGERDVQGAYEVAISCWKLGNYVLFTLTAIFVSSSWLVLKMFNTDNQITNHSIGYLFVFLTCIRQLFDVANMTILRSLWAVGDLFTPIFVSIFTMGIAYIVIPAILIYGLKFNGMSSFIIIITVMIFDPLSRTIIYSTRWIKGSWIKKIKVIKKG